MIIHFADHSWTIIMTASNNLPGGYKIMDDVRVDTLETGVSTFSATLIYDSSTYKTARESVKASNNVLVEKDGEYHGFTIMRTEDDRLEHTIHFEAEDAGLELLNDVAIKYPDNLNNTPSMTLTQYFEMWLSGTGFKIGRNDSKNDTTKKNPKASNDADGVAQAMDNETTITARLKATAELFGYEIGYSFIVSNGKITSKRVNIYTKRGEDTDIRLRLNHEVSNIRITENLDNLCTSLLCYGATVGNQPVTLDGYSYSTGDFVIADQYFANRKAKHACLQSKKALQKYGHYIDGEYHHLTAVFQSEAQTQAKLLDDAKKELTKRCKPEIQYEIEIIDVDTDINIGDYITIIDEEGELYIKARVQVIEESQINKTRTITLTDHTVLS